MLLLTIPIALLAIQNVHSQCLSDNDAEPQNNLTKQNLYYGQLRFTLHLFEAINKIQPTGNIFFSPHSVYNALLLAYFAAGNYTEQSLKDALKLNPIDNKVAIMKAYKMEKFLNEIQPHESYEFTSVNRVYVDKSLPVKDCMLQLFQEEMEALDFKTNADLSRKHINDWVSKVTKNNINDLIPPKGIDDTTKLVLANAAYFKGVWTSRFDSERTTKEIFYQSPDKQTFVQMMKQKGKFNYGISEELGAHILEMPYKGENITMFVLLPPFADKNGIENVLSKLMPDNFVDIVRKDELLPHQVEVQFPKFTIEKTLPLKTVLEYMGASALFDGNADFSSLSGEVGPHFNDAVHKAKIRVDEDGTVAAAATAVFSFRSSRPVDQPKFICNHPFVYFIYDKSAEIVIFMGIFRDPKDLP